MLRVITKPSEVAPPEFVQACMAHLRLDSGEEEPLVRTYLAAALREIEKQTGVLHGVWELEDVFRPSSDENIVLPRRPVVNVVSVTDDTTALTAGTNYRVVGEELEPITFWVSDRITVRWTAGFANADWPDDLRLAALRIVATTFETREDILPGNQSATRVPHDAAILMDGWRRWLV